MRNTKLFQIFDTTGNTVIGPIITSHHEAAAVRQFTDLLKDQTTLLAKHPEDYELRWLGYQDEDTGTIDPTPANTSIVLTGSAWAAMQERKAQDAQ